MGYIWFVIAAIGVMIWFFRDPKEQSTSQSVRTSAKSNEESYFNSISKTTLEQVKGFAAALEQITKVGNCRATPVSIRITKMTDIVVDLEATMSIHGVNTTPFHDWDNSLMIALGKEEPLFVDVQIPRQTNFPDHDSYLNEATELTSRIDRQCCDAINMELFGEKKNYFDAEITNYDPAISGSPKGNVLLKCDFIALPKNNYQKAFAQLAASLRVSFPKANVQASSSNITISF